MNRLSDADMVAYLDRVGLADARPDLVSVNELIRAHQTAVPFENLDVLLGKAIDISQAALFDKIVRRRRGGYCFENNGLFVSVLTTLSLQARLLAARTWYRNPPTTPPETHIVILAQIDGAPYLVDVGFGGTTPRIALPLVEGVYADQDGDIRISRDAEFGWRVDRLDGDNVFPQFSVSERMTYHADQLLANHFMSTHTNSHFLNGLRIALFTETGRLTLFGDQFARRVGRDVVTETVAANESLISILSDVFGLTIPGEESALIEKVKSLTAP